MRIFKIAVLYKIKFQIVTGATLRFLLYPLLQAMSLALLRNHCLQDLRPSFLMSPWEFPQTRLPKITNLGSVQSLISILVHHNITSVIEWYARQVSNHTLFQFVTAQHRKKCLLSNKLNFWGNSNNIFLVESLVKPLAHHSKLWMGCATY